MLKSMLYLKQKENEQDSDKSSEGKEEEEREEQEEEEEEEEGSDEEDTCTYTDKLKAVAAAIGNVEPPGDFVVSGSSDTFPSPGLFVDGLGGVSLPLDDHAAKKVIDKCHLAPYGLEEKTLVDTQVRNTWKLSLGQFCVENPVWQRFVDELAASLCDRMGVRNDVKVQAKLYKMLLYETGGKFERHQDSEKENGMFGTLVIVMPGAFSGGELIVHDPSTQVASSSKTWDPSSESAFTVKYAAFYADCPHEVKPVTEGYRLCLTYNLIAVQDEAVELPHFKGECPQYQALENALTDFFKTDDAQDDRAKQRRLDESSAKSPSGFDITNPATLLKTKFVYVLSHKYTHAALSASNLKNKDLLVAESLRTFCESSKGSLELYLAKIQYYFIWHGNDHEVYEEGELGRDEYIDEWVYITNPWLPYRGPHPHSVDEREMISLFDPDAHAEEDNVEVDRESELAPLGFFSVKKVEFDSSRYIPYTGNEGAEDMRKYTTAALVDVPTRLRWKWHFQRDPNAALARWAELEATNHTEAHALASTLRWSRREFPEVMDALVEAMTKQSSLRVVQDLLCMCDGFAPDSRVRGVVARFEWDAVVEMVVDVLTTNTSLVGPGAVGLVVSVLDGETDPAKIRSLLDAVAFQQLDRPQRWGDEASALSESFLKLVQLAYSASVETLEALLNKIDPLDYMRVAVPVLRSFLESFGSPYPPNLQGLVGHVVSRLELEMDAYRRKNYSDWIWNCTHSKTTPCATCEKFAAFLKSTDETLMLTKAEVACVSKNLNGTDLVTLTTTREGVVASKSFKCARYIAAQEELEILRKLVTSFTST